MPSVPPRPPHSFGQAMPANPALAFSASQFRRRAKASFRSTESQKPGRLHSAGRVDSRYERSSVRNASSSAVKLRSTSGPPSRGLVPEAADAERDGGVQESGAADNRRL